MVKRVVFAAMVAISSSAAAESYRAIAPEAGLAPVLIQEVCTMIEWGFDGVRTDCRMTMREAPKYNPALKGICTTYYGHRTCY